MGGSPGADLLKPSQQASIHRASWSPDLLCTVVEDLSHKRLDRECCDSRGTRNISCFFLERPRFRGPRLSGRGRVVLCSPIARTENRVSSMERQPWERRAVGCAG